jgi:hypothetical protein
MLELLSKGLHNVASEVELQTETMGTAKDVDTKTPVLHVPWQ